MRKESTGERIFAVINTAVLLFVTVVCLYPMVYVLFASLSDSNRLMLNGGKFLYKPLGLSLSAYQKALSDPAIFTGYKNTIVVLVIGVSLSMLFSTIGAYFMSRKNVMFKKPITMMIMFTMWFSGGLIPFCTAVKDIGLMGSRWSLILPTLITTYNMIILRTGFAAVPDSLSESAEIDGAGQIRIMFQIVMPLAKATLMVIVLYYAVHYWNSWFYASIFLQGKSDKWPLQLILRQVLIINDTSSMTSGDSVGDKQSVGESIKYAVIIISTLPILCVYPFIQKYFVKGVMIGAVKG